jgi:hypothetical protein
MDVSGEDDEVVAMTSQERTVWAYLVTVAVTSGTYFALIGSRLAERPAGEIAWVGPMLWTMGLAVVGTILATVVVTIVDAVRHRECRSDGVTSDVRDEDIARVGGRASTVVMSVGFGTALVLAMVDTDTFWIGNALFLFGTVGALVETITKIRLYRRGFA